MCAASAGFAAILAGSLVEIALVNIRKIEQLLGLITAGRIAPERFITHRFTFDQ